MAASRHFGFGETGNTSNRSAVPENPNRIKVIKQEVDRTIRCRDMAILNAKFDDVINDVTIREDH